MVERNDGGPAFAHGNPEQGGDPGMTLRDWFAGQIASRIAVDFSDECDGYCEAIARRSYKMADALLRTRQEGKDDG